MSRRRNRVRRTLLLETLEDRQLLNHGSVPAPHAAILSLSPANAPAASTATPTPAPTPSVRAAPAAAVVPADSSGTVTIQATEAFTDEGSSDPGVFTVTANPAPTAAPLYITYAVDPASTAVSGDDYALSANGAVTIGIGQSSTTIDVNPLDGSPSWDERVNSQNVILDLTSVQASGSGGGGGSYTIGSPSSATVTIRENDDGDTPQVDCLCPCPPGKTNLAPSTPDSNGGDPGDQAVSGSGISTKGQVKNVDPGLISSGFGEDFGPSLAWSNDSGLSNNSHYGVGWVDSSLPALQPTGNGGGIMYVSSGTAALWFDSTQSGTYTAAFFEGTRTPSSPTAPRATSS